MDIDQIKNLVELMVQNDLSRVEIRQGEMHILLRRGQAPVMTTAASHVMAPPVAMPVNPIPPAVASPPPTDGAAAASNEILIRSPMVGTYYERPDPNSPKFINIGDVVGPQTVVCLVEAMKVFNEIKAELSGRIVRALVANGQAVEFDQPLFAVSPA